MRHSKNFMFCLFCLCVCLTAGCQAVEGVEWSKLDFLGLGASESDGREETVHTDVPALLEPVGIKIDTATAYVGDIYNITTYASAVTPYVEPLFFTIDGAIKDVFVIAGQEVKAGDILLTIDQDAVAEQAQALREQLEYTLRNNDYSYRLAELDIEMLRIERERLLADRNAGTIDLKLKEEEIARAEVSLRQTKELDALTTRGMEEEIAAYAEQLGKNELVAPFDGRIVYGVELAAGTGVKAYDPILFLADDTRLSLSGDYISSMYLSGANELYALIGGDRYQISEIPMDQSEYITTVLSGGTLSTSFSIDGPAELLPKLTAGSYAAVCIMRNLKEDVLLVPSNALFRDASGRYVYVMNGEERIRREVKTGGSTDALTQILEGIEEGDVVYVKD